MAFNEVDLSLPDGFNNTVRLFPLPNLVLFPGVMQALHLFEPRYRRLVADALASDELITMALIKSERASEMNDLPDICPIVCVGKIVTHAELDDGRFNLLLMGAKRAKVIHELDRETPYRMAKIELIAEQTNCSQAQATELRQQVTAKFREVAICRPTIDEESLNQLLDNEMPLGQLIDLIGYSLGISTAHQQQLLATIDVCQRAESLLRILESGDATRASDEVRNSPGFPPDFSLN